LHTVTWKKTNDPQSDEWYYTSQDAKWQCKAKEPEERNELSMDTTTLWTVSTQINDSWVEIGTNVENPMSLTHGDLKKTLELKK